MDEKTGPYQVVDLTPGRLAWLNTLDLSRPAHSMVGLLEVDVTVARRIMAAHKARTGETLSFTGFLTYCLARAVDDDKTVQTYRKGNKQLIRFEDVNVGMMIEQKTGETRSLMGYVIRRANHKTFREIHEEIRAVQSVPPPANRGMPGWFRSVMTLPWPLSGLAKAVLGMMMRRDPTIVVGMAGTVGISAVGMFGKGHSGWGIYPTGHPLGLVVGSTAWKPAVVDGRFEPRELLNLTVLFDHEVIDGGPATRFAHRLVELIESGYGLDEEQFPDKPRSEPAAAEREATLA